ncbi:DU1801-containing protein [Leuconostoc gasicomitatum KG16-1]|nr:DU1801-containing protein [Leuconostoc gasicomitatum KG16-1]
MDKDTFSDFEREAMRERAEELRKTKNTEADVLDKISEMTDSEAQIAIEIHHLVKKIAPELKPKTWYSMPAYANKNGKVVLFFQPATKFKARYSTLGFNDAATLDEGDFWPVTFAIKQITPTIRQQISLLIEKSIQK